MMRLFVLTQLMVIILKSVDSWDLASNNLHLSTEVPSKEPVTEVLKLPLSDREKRCFRTDMKVELDKDAVIHTLKLSGSHDCWRYCRVVTKCVVMVFNTEIGVCSLLNYLHLKENSLTTELTVVVLKKCTVQNYGLKMDEVYQFEGEEGPGVLIVQGRRGLQELKCLGVGRARGGEGEAGEGGEGGEEKEVATRAGGKYTLKWKGMCNGADKWVVTRVRQVQELQYLQVAWSEDPSYCLDVTAGVYTPTLLSLYSCRDIRRNDTDPQNLYLLPFTGVGFKESVSLYTAADPGSILTTLDSEDSYFNNNNLLLDLIFQDPAVYPPLHFCPLYMYEVARGEVLNPGKLPLFLAGDSVTVKCKAGYGVKSLNYSQLQIVRCSDIVQVQPCTRLRVRKKEGQCQFYFPVSVVSTISCVVLIGVLLVTCHYTRRSKEEEEGGVREGGDRTKNSQIEREHDVGNVTEPA